MATNYSDFDRNLSALNQDIKLDYDEEAINNSIENILTIRKGEIPGRPEFGSTLQTFLFELMDDITFAGMEQAVYEALIEFEPRIRVTNVEFVPYHSQQIVLMKIIYTIMNSGKELVYQKSFEV